MSKSFYKSKVVPKLIQSFQNVALKKSVEVWTTTCIVTNFGKIANGGNCHVLINPSNPELSGVKNFPYFPRGGPVPKESVKSMHKDWQPLGYVSNWGGMEVGNGMLYAVSVVDGLVHQLGGTRLEMECRVKGGFWTTEKCPVGTAVVTSPGGEQLKQHYDAIVHTTPPFYSHHSNPVENLKSCYREAFKAAFDLQTLRPRVALPLIGAGARGFPNDVAIEVAAYEAIHWRDSENDNSTEACEKIVSFGIPEQSIADALVDAIRLQAEKVA
uniref:Macro domain-containing protein n=1 Tax=Attheya septentrionalis TaxID=420275 RepID=A0A7S2XRZ4_9STRA|mmetsp:Transcript_24337/g.44012  ORF Transcript_24337/g.44012 Transcript_24337/m.44012 type:complete len:270 (+) Transcript_24337:365-1174(+)